PHFSYMSRASGDLPVLHSFPTRRSSDLPKFTRFIAPGSIYAINPIDEKTCLMYVDNLHVKPIDAWDLNAFMKKAEQLRLTGADAGVEDEVNAWMDDS